MVKLLKGKDRGHRKKNRIVLGLDQRPKTDEELAKEEQNKLAAGKVLLADRERQKKRALEVSAMKDN